MHILLVGGGGREHALAWLLARHGHSLVCTHANPGFDALGARTLSTGTDPVAAARAERVDLVVVGPEGPLAEGIVDRLTGAGIPAFGPTEAAARLETSKIHTKRLCLRHGLPTAAALIVGPDDPLPDPGPAVVKLDGLAAGKGVWVCETAEETRTALREARAARPDGGLLVEERMSGREVSLLALCDGERIATLPPARDHKRRFDGDRGPNTGGMGVIAPLQLASLARCQAILQEAVAATAAEGVPFRGVLYGGFMLTEQGPKLLEFNVRFGDPECQALLALWDEDPAPHLLGAATGQLPGTPLRIRAGAACCVVVTAASYPERPANTPIRGLPTETDDLLVFHAGTRRVDGQLYASGGRVINLVGRGATPAEARARAYAAVPEVVFDGADCRHDVGAGSWEG